MDSPGKAAADAARAILTGAGRAARTVRVVCVSRLTAAVLVAGLTLAGLTRPAWASADDAAGGDTAEGALAQGRVALARGDLSAALAAYRTALGVDPTLAAARAGVGECLLRQGDPAKALKEFDASVALAPESGEGHAGRGRAYLAQHFEEDALDEFTQAALDDPDDKTCRAERDRLAARLRKEPGRDWKDLRFQTFNSVWATVNDSYYDPSFGGVDWRAVRTRYRTALESVSTPNDLRSLLQDMLGELRRSHFAILPRDGAVFNPEERTRIGSAGAAVACIEDAPAITRVEPNSPAARAGLKPGDSLVSIDGVDLQPVIGSLIHGGLSAPNAGAYVAQYAESRLEGAVGTTVRLSIRAPNGPVRTASLVCGTEAGPWSEPVGHFPSEPIRCETTRGADGIAIARFNVFALPVMQRMRDFLVSLHPGDGLIIDLRGNEGGLSDMAPGLCGWLFDSGRSIGVIHLRDANQSLDAHPQPNRFGGPVAVLVDGESASTSEILAAGLQATGRARLFGEPTAGAALPSLFRTLPTGDLFQYAIAEATTPSGSVIEGEGVQPDERIRRTCADLAAGRDPVVEAARRWIAGQRPSATMLASRPAAPASDPSPPATPTPGAVPAVQPPARPALAAAAPGEDAGAGDVNGPVYRILRRWVQAQGGYQAFFDFHSYEIDASIESTVKSGPVSEHTLHTGLGAFRNEVSYPDTGILIQASDGQVGWESNERLGFGLLSDKEVKRLADQWDFPIGIQYIRSFRLGRMAEDCQVAGRPCSVLALALAEGRTDFWCFDKDSGQLVRMMQWNSVSGKWLWSTDFSDFRTTGRITLPYVNRSSTSDGQTRTIRWSRLEINPPYDPSVFALPAGRAVEAAAVNAILDRQRKGLGDGRSLSDLRTRIMRCTVDNPVSGLQSEVTTYRKSPNSFLIVSETTGLGRMLTGYDGRAGWSSSEMGGSYALRPDEIAAAYSQISLDSQSPAADYLPLRRYLGERRLNGRPADVVALSSLQGPPATYYFDKADARLLRITAALPGTGDESRRSLRFNYTLDYADFRGVGPVRMPFLVTETNPLWQIVTQVRSVADNVPLDDALFRPRNQE